MNLRDTSDDAAVGLGLLTGAVLVCAGAEVMTAAALGGLVALAIDVPLGSITHVSHHETIRPPLMRGVSRMSHAYKPARPTGYAHGSFGRL